MIDKLGHSVAGPDECQQMRYRRSPVVSTALENGANLQLRCHGRQVVTRAFCFSLAHPGTPSGGVDAAAKRPYQVQNPVPHIWHMGQCIIKGHHPVYSSPGQRQPLRQPEELTTSQECLSAVSHRDGQESTDTTCALLGFFTAVLQHRHSNGLNQNDRLKPSKSADVMSCHTDPQRNFLCPPLACWPMEPEMPCKLS